MLKISSKTEREFFGIVEDRRLGGVPRYYFGYPDDWNMWIPDEVRKCVAFIGVEEVESEKTYYSPKGTGFFVSFADEGNKNLHHIYLITAKHVIEGIGDRRINVRVNYKDGKAKNIILPKETRWFYHPTDSNVDVAITPFYNENFDIKTIPNNMFFSVEELKGEIGIGSEVFITGLFANHYGKEKIFPL